ncbi:neuroglobin [Plakobranchus ocellatus]|uniref:Neuroglobin n=1 Tax=Plakobranchus ocellatus TaxID=259542 RepID=A0AAV4BDT0_9GAST|nr:neuroglobin [Plakobranchus ocellatus]
MGCEESKSVVLSRGNSVRPETQETTVTSLPQTISKFHADPISVTAVEVDSRSPMDERQMFKIKQSWKGIRRNMEPTGVEMFLSPVEDLDRILFSPSAMRPQLAIGIQPQHRMYC